MHIGEEREGTLVAIQEAKLEERDVEGMPVYDASKNFVQIQKECHILQEYCRRAEKVVSSLKGTGACRLMCSHPGMSAGDTMGL